MSRKRRETPLFSIEDIFNRNGVVFDTSKKSNVINIIENNGSVIKLDLNFNLFEEYHLYYSIFYSTTTNKCSNQSIYLKNFKNNEIYKTNISSSKMSLIYNSCKSISSFKYNINTVA